MIHSHRASTALEQRAATLILVTAMGVASLLYLRSIGLAEDDAYITFRYADNFRSGHGLVYNIGERVCGVTSPLYLMTVAAVSCVFHSAPVDMLALKLNLFPFLMTGALTFLLLRKIIGDSLLAAAFGAAMMLDARMITHATDGMESTWFLTWLLASLWAINRRSPVLIGVFCGLATLTRPEGVLILLVAVMSLLKSPRSILAATGIFLATIAPWVIFSTTYFGSPIPLSIVAKARPLYPLHHGHALRALIDVLRPWWVVAVAMASLAILRSLPRARPLVFYVWALVLLYALTNPLMMPWYYASLHALGPALLALGILSLARLRSESEPARLAWPKAGALVVLIASVLVPYDLLPLHERVRSLERRRILPYRELAEKLNAAASPGDLVASPEVGALGYYYHGPMLDGCGLISPETLPYLPVPANQRLNPEVGALPPQLIQDRKPPWIVSVPCFLRHGLLESEWFAKNYTPVDAALLPGELWGERGVLLYRRN